MNKNILRTGPEQFLELSASMPVIDVRTPSEYRKGHIPNAYNLPLFTDDERAIVGTAYKQESKLKAVFKGLDIAGPKMSGLLKEGLSRAGEKKALLVYCWRGGSRSESMAWLFSNAGISCTVLEGGYKAYRNHILSDLGRPMKMIILGGLTGSGKTAILHKLSVLGEQVIDLEGLACHKGSAFGALGQSEQPTSEHFANLLHNTIRPFDKMRRVFTEDESHNIGSVNIPDTFFDSMKKAVVIALMPDIEARLPRLMKEYGLFKAEELLEAVGRISKKLGGEDASRAVSAIRADDLESAIEIVLKYYDSAYRYGLSQRPERRVLFVDSPSDDPEDNVQKVICMAEKIDSGAIAF
ncbi:MAG: tRNA 2-selenouridine(34) synthase MnmH [Bacteroidales bacterium]|nr:tRNA 2-selenouridine(34) synthase MnmH [Bacteroidales bacterium]